MTTTTKHVLQLVAGPMRAVVTETDDKVVMELTGAKALGFEKRKVEKFLRPIVDSYQDDPRLIVMSGAHIDWTVHIVTVPEGWKAYIQRRGSRK